MDVSYAKLNIVIVGMSAWCQHMVKTYMGKRLSHTWGRICHKLSSPTCTYGDVRYLRRCGDGFFYNYLYTNLGHIL